MIHLAQLVRLSCTNTNTISKWTDEIPYNPCHQGVPSGASKTISESMVRSAQTVHLSCASISSIPKQTESSFHLSLITLEYHCVCPKRYLSLWYVWCKPCTYLAPTLTVSKRTETRFHLTHVTLEFHQVHPK